VLQIRFYSLTICEFFSWSTAAAGNYAYAFKLDVKRDVSVAPGGPEGGLAAPSLRVGIDFKIKETIS
jgi:hypothetical protein